MSKEQIAIRTTYFSIFSNAFLALVKGISGYLGNSFALLADAIESTTDIFSSIIVLLGIQYVNKPADKNHPYGHGRAEPLITFLVVGFLITSAMVIAYQSIQNIKTPHEAPKPFTLIVLGLIILWKEYSYRKVLQKSIEIKSTALKADAWHHRSDAITSVAAFVGNSIAIVGGKGYEVADDWAALFAAGFIVYNCYLIFRPALGEIMDEHLYDDVIDDIRRVSLQVEGILDTEKCFIRKIGMVYHVELHAIVDGEISVRKGHELAHILQDTLKETIEGLQYIVIHVEPNEVSE